MDQDVADIDPVPPRPLGVAPTPCDAVTLAAPLRDLVDALRPAAADRKLYLSLRLPVDTPAVRADPAALRDTLRRLLGDALDRTRIGGVAVCVLPHRRDGWVAVDLHDTAAALDAEAAAALFEHTALPGARLTVQTSPADGNSCTLWLPRA